jgi:hypothetical protein
MNVTSEELDALLDELIDMRDQRDEARQEAQEWRNLCIIEPNMSQDQFEKAIDSNLFPWEQTIKEKNK